MREEKINKEVLLRYLKGRGSKEDKTIINQWFTDSVMENELNETSLQFWDELPLEPNVKGYSGTHILDKIHHKIKIEEAIFFNKTKPKIGIVIYLARIAAILTIPLLIALLFFYFQNRSFNNSISWAEIHAPSGTRADFSLQDGSTGRLNGGSSLRFPTKFGRKVRDVKLTGEAYFDVISNLRKPFIVSTESIDVKVTGTSFNVIAYPDELKTEVTLKNGQVEIFKKNNGITTCLGALKPDESFIYNSLTDSGIIQSVNVAERLSWLDGKLKFKYEPFQDVITKLNRWYNANIIIMDESLNSYIYYGTFQNETLDEVLKLICLTAPIRYKEYEREQEKDGTFKKRKIEIYNKN